MGARNPDTIASPPSPLRALTVAEMHAERWTILADCPACKTRLHVSTADLRRLAGDDAVLWGKTGRCRVWVRWNPDRRCEGRVTFWAQASMTGSPVPLKMSGEVRDAIQLRSQATHLRT